MLSGATADTIGSDRPGIQIVDPSYAKVEGT